MLDTGKGVWYFWAMKKKMSRSKATKRRKVWVTYDYAGLCEVFSSHERARRAARISRIRWADDSDYETVTPFVEVRRGEVVLSRKDVAARKHAAERLESWLKDMNMENFDECDHIRQSCGDVDCTRPVTDAITLLRGGR